MPAGIVSIVYAARVDGLYANGAATASRNTRTRAIVSAVLGLLTAVFYVVVAGDEDLALERVRRAVVLTPLTVTRWAGGAVAGR